MTFHEHISSSPEYLSLSYIQIVHRPQLGSRLIDTILYTKPNLLKILSEHLLFAQFDCHHTKATEEKVSFR